MRRTRKGKYVALALAASLVFSVLAGSSTQPAAAKEDSEEVVMGRYVEEEVKLPGSGCLNVERLCFLEGQKLRVLYRDSNYMPFLADSADQGKSFEMPPRNLYEEFGAGDSAELMQASLASDGGVFAVWATPAQDQETFYNTCEYLSPEGEKKELAAIQELGDIPVKDSRFSEDGQLFLLAENTIYQVDVSKGELVKSYEETGFVQSFALVGSRLLVLLEDTIHYYDIKSGEPTEDEPMLTEQLSVSSWQDVILAAGEEMESILYANRDGMYHYSFSGSVVEQVIDGSFCSMSSPAVTLMDLAWGKDGAFYVAVQEESGSNLEGKLLRYIYDENVAAVPETTLCVYSLEENDSVRQAAALFSETYPEIYVRLMEGKTEDGAVTTTDALKTLNTEIMADNGPDVLILDGIPAATYMERGLLADISGIVEEAGLLKNIQDAYETEEGSIYQIPARFAMPVLFGTEENLSEITDLSSLADIVEANQSVYTESFYPSAACATPQYLLHMLFETSAPAWIKEDGQLQEEQIRAFFEDAGRIYAAGKESAQTYFQGSGFELPEVERNLRFSEKTSLADATAVYEERVLLAFGNLYSLDSFFLLTTIENEKPQITHKLLRGQEENVFVPQITVGISAKAKEKEAAELFVEFLLGEEMQKTERSAGFPVRASVYESDAYWELGQEGSFEGAFGWRGYGEGRLDLSHSSDEQLKELKEWGKTLTIPAVDNEIILTAVTEAGSRYLNGETDLDTAVREAVSQVNLYLAE